jgi:hypothetical protein
LSQCYHLETLLPALAHVGNVARKKGIEELMWVGQPPAYVRTILASSTPATVPLGRQTHVTTANDQQSHANTPDTLASDTEGMLDVPVASFCFQLAHLRFGEVLATREAGSEHFGCSGRASRGARGGRAVGPGRALNRFRNF